MCFMASKVEAATPITVPVLQTGKEDVSAYPTNYVVIPAGQELGATPITITEKGTVYVVALGNQIVSNVQVKLCTDAAGNFSTDSSFNLLSSGEADTFALVNMQ